MTGTEAIALTSLHQMANYARYPVTFVRGEGSWLFDDTGKPYLDFLGGIAVALLGHARPEVTRAIAEQAGKLLHVSNLFHVPSQARLGERLSHATTGGKVFFCNSGTEANAAIRAGAITGGMIPKVECGLTALRKGVRKVHVLDGRVPHSVLLEIFTDAGIGTEIVRSPKGAAGE